MSGGARGAIRQLVRGVAAGLKVGFSDRGSGSRSLCNMKESTNYESGERCLQRVERANVKTVHLACWCNSQKTSCGCGGGEWS